MTIEKPSRTPWRLGATPNGHEIITADGKIVCDDEQYYPVPVTLPHMEYIVKACNAHPELIDTLQKIAGIDISIRVSTDGWDVAHEFQSLARAVLAEIEKGATP